MHKHISEFVPAPSRFCNIPVTIEALILKLLQKTPEDRYQSVTGLLYDLDLLIASFEKSSINSVSASDIGKNDHASRFNVSGDLVGRESEINALIRLYDSVVSDSHTRVATIGGYSGVGKSRLVKEALQDVVFSGVFYTECKFDQYKNFVPFSTMKILVSDLLSQIFTEPQAVLAKWCNKIMQALGTEARSVCDLCPDLVILLGTEYVDKLEPIVPLGALASEERLRRGLRRLIQVFASPQHRLIMFIDDAQCSPPADLQMLLNLREQSDTFIVCAFRDNEVGPDHMLRTIFLDNVAADLHVTLEALTPENTKRLVAATLRNPVPPESQNVSHEQDIHELSNLIYLQTQGNCFFTSQLLTTRYREGYFQFDFNSGQWTWHLEDIRSYGLPSDVVELVIRQVTKLTPSCQQILKTASCLGNSSFRVDILEICTHLQDFEITQEIFGAMSAGLVLANDINNKVTLTMNTLGQWRSSRSHQYLNQLKQ